MMRTLGKHRLVLLGVLLCGVVLAAWPVPAAVLTTRPVGDEVLFRTVALWTLLNVALGAVMIWQRPRQLYPWLMFSAGLIMVRLETSAFHTGADSLYFVAPALPALLAQLFPTGRPIPGRWGWLTYLSPVALIGAMLTSRWLSDSSPAMAFLGVAWVVGLLATFPLVALRFRRSAGAERAQLKWFLFAVTAAFVLWLGSTVLIAFHPNAGAWGSAIALSLPVVAIAVALLRYRLYDIDRVISRTASYAVVSGLLLATYIAVAASISALIGRASTIAVAAATLTAAALARPVLRRVQETVDRRFNRSRYDAIHTVDTFGSRLRNQVDPHHVSDDLVAVVNTTLQPNHITIWIRQPSSPNR
ncbi:MAG: hypothetical protein WAN48_05975 [Actinomycetes bacterium]